RRGRIEDRCAENSLPLQTGWNSARPDCSGLQPRALVVNEEESLVGLYRPAEDKSILVPTKSRFWTCRSEEVARIQCLISQKFEKSSVKLIRSGLVVHHNDAAVRPPVLGGVGVGVDAELLDRVDDREVGDLPGLGLKDADPVIDVLAYAR